MNLHLRLHLAFDGHHPHEHDQPFGIHSRTSPPSRVSELGKVGSTDNVYTIPTCRFHPLLRNHALSAAFLHDLSISVRIPATLPHLAPCRNYRYPSHICLLCLGYLPA